jgi:tetratricopeptide (TPR) repeat protein
MTEGEKILQTKPFERSYLPVAPAMERALGYTGERRFVAFHWSKRWNSLCWSDSPFNSARSGSTVWRRFLGHPVVAPYLQRWTRDFDQVEAIDFESNDDGDVKSVPQNDAEEKTAAKELGDALLLDRQDRVVYIAAWVDVGRFLLLLCMNDADDTKEKEEEDVNNSVDGVDYDDDPVPVDPTLEEHLLAWLTGRVSDPDGLYGLAAVHSQFRQFREALSFLRRALELRPESDLLYYRLSQVYGALGNWEEALEACAQAVRLEGSSGRREYTTESLFMLRALCLMRLKRYSEAIETYKFLLQLRPDQAHVYREMGACWTALQQHASAVDAYEHEVQVRTAEGLHFGLEELEREELSESFGVLGEAYLRNNQLQEARWACEQGVRLTPNCAEAHAALAEVYMGLGDEQRAVSEYERAGELGFRGTVPDGET